MPFPRGSAPPDRLPSCQLACLQSLDRLEAEPKEFHERVRQEFLQIAMMDSERYFVVDGTQSVDEIHKQIIERVAELPALKRNAAGPQPNRLLRPIRFATNAVTSSVSRAARATTSTEKKRGS